MFLDSYGRYVFFDGAMGTMLQKKGLKKGERPDGMNLTVPDDVEEIHRLYVEAGSDIICTNTFGANASALEGTGFSPEDIITAGVAIARRASSGAAKVALDMGPIGRLLEPVGELKYEKAYELFKEQAVIGEKAGADLVAIETMSDIVELKAAVLAVTENTSLPVFATMTFNKYGRTYMGYTPEDLAAAAQQLGVCATGLNCSLEPSEMFEAVEGIAEATSLPIIIKPNAGLPDSATGSYGVDPIEFALQMVHLVKTVEISARQAAQNPDSTRRIIIGGCCGTTPNHIIEMRKVFKI